MLAALQAPVIMMSQNRQDTKDRLRGELDFDVNRRAESEIQGLSRKLNSLDEKMGDIEDFLRGNQALGLTEVTSKIASTSTAAPVGSDANPSALRA
jgi:uncharacterized membrane protein